MSAFWTTCPDCGTRYFHMFVGTRLVHGHDCPDKDAAIAREMRSRIAHDAGPHRPSDDFDGTTE